MGNSAMGGGNALQPFSLQELPMWIVKGTLLALWLFGFGTMALLYFSIYRHLPPNSAVGVSAFSARTIHNPYWWTALVICIVLGYSIAHSWRGPLGLWIALL